MNVRILGAILTAMTALPTVAVEPGHGYAGILISKIGYDASIDVDGDTYDVEAEPEAFFLRLGYQLSEHVSIEARYGAGVSDGSMDIDDEDSGADVGIDSYYGAFIRAHLPNKTGVTPYFIAGYNQIELELDGGGNSVNDDDNDLAMGLGADFAAGTAVISLEYLEIYDKNNAAGDALSLGVAMSF